MRQKYPLLHKSGEILLAIADRVTVFARKVEAVSGKWPEILVLLIYAAAHLGMALVHEPFFDEAEAWQIARCVSLRTLFLETTHYEGHPPLWHLILMPLAKAGAPYELSLTLVSLLFMGTAAYLILRYAPFPRVVRLLLPFTYFFFYQYGVISRVYCVMTLAFVLLAMAYRRRNERPGRYVAVLILLCMTMAYGLVIAGGLAIVWLWEIWNESRTAGVPSVRKIVREWAADRRIRWLAVLLAAALVVVWMIMPREDTYATAAMTYSTNPFFIRLIYMLLVLPADVTLTNVYSNHCCLKDAFLSSSVLVSGCIVGLLLWSLILYYGKKKGTLLLCIIPYSFFAVFAAAVYVAIHHTGIGLLYLLFWAWSSAESGGETVGAHGAESVMKTVAVLLGALAMVVSLCWTVMSCMLDIDKIYATGREEAKFIREHHLDRYRIMSRFAVSKNEAGEIEGADINECDRAVNAAPYFEHNIFFNFNEGRDDRNYVVHIRLTEKETQQMYEVWRQAEPPQVLWMTPELWLVYGDEVKRTDYLLVYQAPAEMIWKGGADFLSSDIYVHRDILEETGLQPLKVGE